MARKPTGTIVRTRKGQWQGLVTTGDGSRKRLPPFPVGTSEADAREKTAIEAKRQAKRRAKPVDLTSRCIYCKLPTLGSMDSKPSRSRGISFERRTMCEKHYRQACKSKRKQDERNNFTPITVNADLLKAFDV